MRLPTGRTPLGMLEQKLEKSSRNPATDLSDSKKKAKKLSNIFFEFPKYTESVYEINKSIDEALSAVGIQLRHYVDQAIPYGQTRQFILETTDPNIFVAVQIYRTPGGRYEVVSYPTYESQRKGRKRNPEGDYEHSLAEFISRNVVLKMRDGEILTFPLPNGKSIALHCRLADPNGFPEYRALLQEVAYVESGLEGNSVREAKIFVKEDTGFLGFDEFEQALHEMLHQVQRRANPSDEEPTELPGEDIEAGVGEEMPEIVDAPEEADRIYESFHGRPSEEEIFAEEEIQIRENLSVLGRLVQIVCESISNSQPYRINFGEDVMLCVSSDGKQLYIVGGDQSLNLNEMEFSPEQQQKDKVFIGSAQQVTYRTRKHFDNFAEIDYVHDFGEDGGTLPALIYDRLNQVIEFAGGDYEIKPEGIVN